MTRDAAHADFIGCTLRPTIIPDVSPGVASFISSGVRVGYNFPPDHRRWKVSKRTNDSEFMVLA